MTVESRTVNIGINRPPDEVYTFVSHPENLPKWAPNFCQSVRRVGMDWVVETSDGPMKVRFAEKNSFRVADHYITSAFGVEINVPMRVLPNSAGGSHVTLTLFKRPDMSDAQFARDIEMVTQDLNALKKFLEN